jgi:hypothetical protein
VKLDGLGYERWCAEGVIERVWEIAGKRPMKAILAADGS